jgi:hypothetical protein
MKIWSTWRDKSLVAMIAVVLAFSSASWAADDGVVHNETSMGSFGDRQGLLVGATFITSG